VSESRQELSFLVAMTTLKTLSDGDVVNYTGSAVTVVADSLTINTT